MRDALADPGPMARFVALTRDETTPAVIVQRLTEGESLRDMASAWEVPYKRFLAWIAANGELTEQCKRVRELAGIELRMEGLDIVDAVEGAEEPAEVAAAKLRAEYRERLSRDLNRPLFGRVTQHKHEHTFDLGDRLRRARERSVNDLPAAPPPPAIPAPGLVVEADNAAAFVELI